MGKKLYIIAGEASGDLHGSNLVKQLKRQDESLVIRAWGGDLMQEAGAEVVKHYRDLAFMGFTEVLMNLRTILNNLKQCKQDILAFDPDALILIDYPGFNLRIAKWAKKKGIRVFYYISPQIWAWKQSRVHAIKRDVDKMFTILPFEKEFYDKYGFPVEYVGNPLLDAIEQFREKAKSPETFRQENNLTEKDIIAVLPGSRKQEISKMLPLMLQTGKFFPEYQFVIAAAPSIDKSFYREFTGGYDNFAFVAGQTYDLLNNSRAALVTSGTATLETALFEVPEVVCYKANAASVFIARKLIKVDYISLVNLIMNEEIVRELIQKDLTVDNLVEELDRLLYNKKHLDKLRSQYAELKQRLGGGGASKRAATQMLEALNS